MMLKYPLFFILSVLLALSGIFPINGKYLNSACVASPPTNSKIHSENHSFLHSTHCEDAAHLSSSDRAANEILVEFLFDNDYVLGFDSNTQRYISLEYIVIHIDDPMTDEDFISKRESAINRAALRGKPRNNSIYE